MFFLASLILAATAMKVYDPNVRPLVSNVDPDHWMAKFNPRITIRDDCHSSVAYTTTGPIVWDFDKDSEKIDLCHNSKLSQIYGKFILDSNWNELFIYSWRQLYSIPATGSIGWTWEFAAVYVDVVDGTIQKKPKTLWTTAGGYSEDIYTDDDGQHPRLQQSRPDQYTSAAMLSADVASGEIWSLIDVDAIEGEWTPEARAAFDVDMNPLAGKHLAAALHAIEHMQGGIGFPGMRIPGSPVDLEIP